MTHKPPAKQPQNITKHPQNTTKHKAKAHFYIYICLHLHLLTKQPTFANKPTLALALLSSANKRLVMWDYARPRVRASPTYAYAYTICNAYIFARSASVPRSTYDYGVCYPYFFTYTLYYTYTYTYARAYTHTHYARS